MPIVITIPLSSSLDDLIPKVRVELGGSLQQAMTEVADAVIEDKLTEGAAEISKRVRGSSTDLRYMTTIADQQKYTPDADVLTVLEVYWRGNSTNFTPDFGEGFPDLPFPDSSAEAYQFRSLQLIEEQKLKAYSSSLSVGPGSDIIGGQIYLDPVPTTAGVKVYYLCLLKKDVSEIVTKYEKALILYAKAVCLPILAMRRTNKGVTDREGQYARTNIEVVLKEAERTMKLFEDEVAGKSRDL